MRYLATVNELRPKGTPASAKHHPTFRFRPAGSSPSRAPNPSATTAEH